MVVKNGAKFSAHSGHPMFKKIVARVRRKAFGGIEKLFSFKDVIEKCFNVEIKNGEQLFYKGILVNNVLTQKIIKSMADGTPYKPYVKLLNNLMQNPSALCREQLFNYIEKYGLAIDSNGWVYGYKAVDKNLVSKYDGKTKYAIGQATKVDRNKCATSETDACGYGLHLGETSYVLDYGRGDDRYLLLKFNPKDGISCPMDCSYKKLRVCSLVPIREVTRDQVAIPLADQYLGELKKKRKKKARTSPRKKSA